LGVVALNTNKMVYAMDCLEKMYLAEEEVAEAEEVDIAHTQASWLMNSGPPDRGLEVAGQGQAGDIDHKALQAYYTVHSSQRHWDRWGRSVAAEAAGHMDHKELRRSVGADIEYSVAGNGRIDAVAEAGVVDAEAGATMTDTAQDMVVGVDVADDVADVLTGEGALGSGERVGGDGGRARERDVEVEVVGRTQGVAAAGAGARPGQTAEAEEHWNVYGGRTGQTGPRRPEEYPFPIPQYSEGG
jgi:hypothetical protein